MSDGVLILLILYKTALMFIREIIAGFSEIHAKHINALYWEKVVSYLWKLNIVVHKVTTRLYWLMYTYEVWNNKGFGEKLHKWDLHKIVTVI